jgi:hypothetical protein
LIFFNAKKIIDKLSTLNFVFFSHIDSVLLKIKGKKGYFCERLQWFQKSPLAGVPLMSVVGQSATIVLYVLPYDSRKATDLF